MDSVVLWFEEADENGENFDGYTLPKQQQVRK